MAAGDESAQQSSPPALKPLGELKVSSVQNRGMFHILTEASAEDIAAFFAKRLQDKNVPFVQSDKNPAKFTFERQIVEDSEVQDSCTIKVRVMKA